jgi:hypothetical protein
MSTFVDKSNEFIKISIFLLRFIMAERRRNLLSWNEVTAIINASDSECELSDEEKETDEFGDQDVYAVPDPRKARDLFDVAMDPTEDFVESSNNELNEPEEMEFPDIPAEQVTMEFEDTTTDIQLTDKKKIQWRNRVFEKTAFDFVENDDEEPMMLTPFQLFSKYVPNTLMQEFAKFTNMYALQSGLSFQPTCTEEIVKLIGVHVLMGVLSLLQLRLYWSQNLDIRSISSIMFRNRFYQLRNNLHLVDNNTSPSNCKDKFLKFDH